LKTVCAEEGKFTNGLSDKYEVFHYESKLGQTESDMREFCDITLDPPMVYDFNKK